jgi:hypothetical protein
MIQIYKNHLKSKGTSRLVYEIIFDEEFADLCQELAHIYKEAGIEKPEQEAFEDAFYAFLMQKELRYKALSSSR